MFRCNLMNPFGHLDLLILRLTYSCTNTNHFFVLFVLLFPPKQTPLIPVASIADANDKNAMVCATTGNNNWCTDCAPWSATPFAVINDTYPSIQLVWINSTNPTGDSPSLSHDNI